MERKTAGWQRQRRGQRQRGGKGEGRGARAAPTPHLFERFGILCELLVLLLKCLVCSHGALVRANQPAQGGQLLIAASELAQDIRLPRRHVVGHALVSPGRHPSQRRFARAVP